MLDRPEVERQLDSALHREGGGREIDVVRTRLLLDIRETLRASALLALADGLDRRSIGGISAAANVLRLQATAMIEPPSED